MKWKSFRAALRTCLAANGNANQTVNERVFTIATGRFRSFHAWKTADGFHSASLHHLKSILSINIRSLTLEGKYSCRKSNLPLEFFRPLASSRREYLEFVKPNPVHESFPWGLKASNTKSNWKQFSSPWLYKFVTRHKEKNYFSGVSSRRTLSPISVFLPRNGLRRWKLKEKRKSCGTVGSDCSSNREIRQSAIRGHRAANPFPRRNHNVS